MHEHENLRPVRMVGMSDVLVGGNVEGSDDLTYINTPIKNSCAPMVMLGTH